MGNIDQLETSIADRLAAVQTRIDAAAARAGRDSAEITLVAVTKTWPLETVLAAYAVGLRHFGENRAEEMAQKRVGLAAEMAASGEDAADVVWHQIGTLQSRKTGIVAESADYFHALDRIKIANRLSKTLVDLGRELPVLIEVNLSGEASKSGFKAENWEQDATQREALRTVLQTAADLPGIRPVGLMTMAPWGAPEDEIRRVFARCRELKNWLSEAQPDVALTELSMGMTNDFELGIEEGATLVRIGRALFGERQRH